MEAIKKKKKRWSTVKSKIITIRITEDFNSKLEKKAYRSKKNVSDFIRDSVEFFLAKK